MFIIRKVKAEFLLFRLVAHILTSRHYRVTFSKLQQLYQYIGFEYLYYGAVTVTFRKEGTIVKNQSFYKYSVYHLFVDCHIKTTGHRATSRFFHIYAYICHNSYVRLLENQLVTTFNIKFYSIHQNGGGTHVRR